MVQRSDTASEVAVADPVVHLDDDRALDPAVGGRKAATLARLRRRGFSVPDGFVVTAEACSQLDDDTLPAALDAALRSLGDDIPVAVRSSAAAEDLAEASYAGIYETVLDVRGPEAVTEAVRRCVASARSARVAAYSPAPAGAMAVLVQAMVDARAAGVAFSADPVSGDRDVTVVSAVRGLGDRLVEGTASPDEWSVRGDDVDERSYPERSLTDDQVRAVAELARHLEDEQGAPQDVEWAWDGDRLWLLQARPITVLPRRPELDLPESGSWMKDRTHYPEPVSPFGASVYLPALEAGIARMCEEFGLLIEGVEQRSLGGEIYGHPVPVGGKEGPPPPWWVMAALARVVPPIRRRCAAARRAVRSGLLEELPQRWEREWRDELVDETARLADVDLANLDDEELLAHLDEAVALLHRGQEIHFRLFLPFLVPVRELVRTGEELLGWDTARILELVAGRSGASTAPSRALEELAVRIGTDPGAREAVESLDLDALADRPEAWAAFDEYRRRWGVRAVGYDPGSATLAEQPHLLLRWLRDLVTSDEGATDPTVRSAGSALARAREALAQRDEADRERFEAALARAEAVYGLREDNITWTDNVPCGVIRLAAIEIGRRLHQRGLLDRGDDAVFLEVDEARSALRDGVDSAALARRRRAERAWVASHPGPPLLGDEPAPPPDVRGLPEEARFLNEPMMWAMSHEFAPPGESATAAEALVDGIGASAGTCTGPVRVIADESQFAKLRPGDVLVCRITTPSWSVLFGRAGAVVADGGGALSHSAIVAREHGIPAVLATGDATATLSDGDLVTVDGTSGVVLAADTDAERPTLSDRR